MTDPRAQQPHAVNDRELTRRQISSLENLPDDHELISVRGRVPLVRRADGRLLRIRPNGRLVATIPVEHVRSYLHVRAS
jgi:hypothetical protein